MSDREPASFGRCDQMRVMLASPVYPPRVGGVERHVYELAKGLAARNVAIEVAVADPAATGAHNTVDDGVIVHRFPTLLGDSTFNVSARLGLWLLENAPDFDVVHAHGYHSPVPFQGLVAARRAGKPFVFTPHYHGTGHSQVRNLLHIPYRPFGRAAMRGARVVIGVSTAETDHIRQDFGNVRTAVAANGVDVDAILSTVPMDRDRSRRLVVAMARLEQYKQVDRLVEAMAYLGEATELVVIGDGPEKDRLERQVVALGLRSRVRLLGNVATQQLRQWLRAADAFVTLSRHEAFGIGPLEAAAAGAGVVASDIPAHREVAGFVADDWVTFVDKEADPRTVAKAVERAAQHDVDEQSLSAIPRWSNTVDATLDAYRLAVTR